MLRFPFLPAFVLFPMSRRTISVSLHGWRTSVVHGFYPGLFAVSAVLVLLSSVFNVAVSDPGSAGRQQRLQAEGWLRLKQDQKTYRDSVEPLAPGKASRLDQLERGQQGRARELEQRQRQSLNSERNRRRREDSARPVTRPRELDTRRQLDRQRLEMRIQRDSLRPGLR